MNNALQLLVIFGSVLEIVAMLSYFKNRRIERTPSIATEKDASVFNAREKKEFHTQLFKV